MCETNIDECECEVRCRCDEIAALKQDNMHLFNLLKSVYFAIDGSSEGLPIPAEIWDEIEYMMNALKSNDELQRAKTR
jgi:hypothetical protein